MIFLALLKYFQKSSFLFGHFWVHFEVNKLNLFFHYLLKIEAAYLFLQVAKLIFVYHCILFDIFLMGHISHVLLYESYYFLYFLYFLDFLYFLYFPYYLYFLHLLHWYLYYFLFLQFFLVVFLLYFFLYLFLILHLLLLIEH